jgi:hypothetical protein
MSKKSFFLDIKIIGFDCTESHIKHKQYLQFLLCIMEEDS